MRTVLPSLLLLLILPAVSARVVTLNTQVLDSDPSSTALSTTLPIREGEIAEVLFTELPGGSAPAFISTVQVNIVEGSFSIPHAFNQEEINANGFPVIAGPASIFVVARKTNLDSRTATRAFATIRVTTPAEDPKVPSSSVVIPTEPEGSVRIILESSVDQVTWTVATPGVYGTSAERRFFRVRAERIQQ